MYTGLVVLLLICIQMTKELQLELKSNTRDELFNSLRKLQRKEISELYEGSYVMIVNMCIGKPPQCFDLDYDIANHFTWVLDYQPQFKKTSFFKASNSSTCFIGENRYEVDNMRGISFRDYIQFTSVSDEIKNKTQNLFDMFMISHFDDNAFKKYTGTLGLNRFYDKDSIRIERNQKVNGHPKYSFINYLYNNNLIQKKIFAHSMTHNDKGILYLGETGTTEVNYPTCSSHSSDNYASSYYSSYWHCPISNIFDDTNKEKKIGFQEEINVVFDSNFEYIVLPNDYWKILFNTISGVSNSKCVNKQFEESGLYKQCEYNSIANLPSLSFEISKIVNITLSPIDIWTPSTIEKEGKTINVYNCRIISNNYLKSSIVLGSIALDKYHMIFDYDNDSIGFASKDNSKTGLSILMTPKEIFKALMFYFQIMMVIMVALALLVIYQHKEIICSFKKTSYIQSEKSISL